MRTSFGIFALAVVAGNAASYLAARLTSRAFKDPDAAQAAAAAASVGAFWLVGGVAYVALAARPAIGPA